MSSFIPDTAPFNEEQRAWLNGFFAGLMGVESDGSATGVLDQPATESIAGENTEAEEEEFPWHDSSLPIVDRMEMAEGKPLERRLMAAMAQLDCGSCGYVCQTYAEAIASGNEKNLTLCSPGGKETKQMVKKLVKDAGDAAPVDGSVAASAVASPAPQENGYSRQNPYPAKLIESRPLNKPGSCKDTRHVAIDLADSELTYHVGDALGIYPTNCSELVDAIMRRLKADADLAVDSPLGERKSLRLVLTEDCCLKDPSDELLELLAEHTPSSEARSRLQALLEEGVDDAWDVLDVISLAGDAPIAATEFVETLSPLNPRLYSIASSMKAVGSEVHLTVGKVASEINGRLRKGVASTMLAERVGRGDIVRVFVQPNHGGFTVPADPMTPMIMIGPGTGIAPFMAFLQERHVSKAGGKNWLFFGDQHRQSDFLYEDELQSYLGSGLLSRLDTAFSRDGEQKLYVQHRLQENADELWQWIKQGAHLYVCGDASRMARDVHQTLIEIAAQQQNVSMDQAKAFIEQMQKDGLYVRDVY